MFEKRIAHRGEQYVLKINRELSKFDSSGIYITAELFTLNGIRVVYRATGGHSPQKHRIDELNECILGSWTEEGFKNQGFGSLLLKETLNYLKLEGSFTKALAATYNTNIPCLKMLNKVGMSIVESSDVEIKCFQYDLSA